MQNNLATDRAPRGAVADRIEPMHQQIHFDASEAPTVRSLAESVAACHQQPTQIGLVDHDVVRSPDLLLLNTSRAALSRRPASR